MTGYCCCRANDHHVRAFRELVMSEFDSVVSVEAMREYFARIPEPKTLVEVGQVGEQGITDDTPREIVVLDVLDQTAAAKLTAMWGIDYFHLEKVEGKWMIRHVMWQSHPQGS